MNNATPIPWMRIWPSSHGGDGVNCNASSVFGRLQSWETLETQDFVEDAKVEEAISIPISRRGEWKGCRLLREVASVLP